jgi:thiol reductant ABC exporter CydD subunit
MSRPAAERGQRVDRRLSRETRAARTHVKVAAGLGLATAATVVAQAALLAEVIARSAVGHVPLSALGGTLVALAGVIAARAALAAAFDFNGRLGAQRVMAELRARLARALLIDRPGRRPTERTGELAAAAVQGVDSLESYYAGYLPSLMLATFVPLAVLAWVAPIDLGAAIILAVTVPILIVFMVLIGKGAQAATRGRWRALSLLSSHFLDVVRGLETLRAHRREAAQVVTLADVGERYRRETMATLRLAFMSALVLELCAMLGTALVAVSIGVELAGGHLALQAGLTVLLLAPELYAPLRAVGQQFHASADGLAAAERLLDVLDEPPAVGARDGGLPAPDPRVEPLTLRHVSYEYPGRKGRVLDGVDLELAPGRITVLISRSGAGKSTIASLALRLCDPVEGSVRCGRVDLRDVDPDAWRARTAWVPQRTRLFTGTLAENIALATPNARSAEIEHAAREAGLGDLLDSLADGLATPVGDGGRRLSAGQAQRVALARAFLSDAPLVVLDEPTANLDADSVVAIAGAIERLARGRTTLLITHDHRLLDRADHVVDLGATRVSELEVAA